MRMSRLLIVALLTLAAVLAGCGKQPAPAADSTSPDASVLATAHLLKVGDLDALMHHLLPPTEYGQLREDWGKDNGEELPSEQDEARFAAAMQQLTAPGAETKLLAQLRPVLAKYDSTYKAQLPALVGIVQPMLTTQIDNDHDLTIEQRKQAKAVVEALGGWAQHVPWGDEARAQQAIGIVVQTARQLNLKTLDQAYALDYTAAMQRYGQVWNGLKAVLAVYGLSIDGMLDSVSAKTLENDGHTARVAVHYTVLGKPMDTEVILIRQDGHWYNRDILASWRRAHARVQQAVPAAASTAAVAPAASSAAPASAATVQGAH